MNTKDSLLKNYKHCHSDSKKGVGIEPSFEAKASRLTYVFNKRKTFCGIALACANCAVAD